MNSAKYIEELVLRLSKNFDIKHNVELLDEEVAVLARMEVHNQQHFAVKKIKIWHAENYEYVIVKIFDSLDELQLEAFTGYLKKALDNLVKPHSEHMYTIITGIIVTDDFSESLEKKIKRFKYRKTYALSLKGWAEIRLLGVSLHSNRVISNRKGKEVEDFYLPLGKEDKKGLLNFIKK